MNHGRLGHLTGEDAIRNEEDVGVEPGTLMAGTHLPNDPVDRDLLSGRKNPVERDNVIQLKVGARPDRDPEFKRRGVIGSEDSTDVL